MKKLVEMFVFVSLALIMLILRESSQVAEVGSECGNPREAFSTHGLPSSITEFGCPAYSNNDLNQLKKLSLLLKEWEHCLIERTFSENQNAEKICQLEVKPFFFLTNDMKQKPKTCGGKKNRYMYNFGYVYCRIPDDQDEEKLEESNQAEISSQNQKSHLIDNIKNIPIYHICYDILENRTIWVRHQIRTPALFHNTPHEEEQYCNTEIDTEGYFFGSEQFLKMKHKYKLEETKDASSEVQMIPQPMVPMNHFFKRLWKKTTKHFINIASLWSKLVPLMTTIDNAIKLVAIKTKIGGIGPEEDLLVYTRTKPYFSPWYKVKRALKMGSFEPNVWYKFVYSSQRQAGILIHIHNTPGTPVRKKGEPLCKIHEWPKLLNNKNVDNSKVRAQYAYCSRPTTKEVDEIFHIKVIILSLLDLDTELRLSILSK